MFQFFSELGFRLIQPAIVAVLRKKQYPKEAIKRKFGEFKETFSNEDNVIMVHGVSVGEMNALEHLIKSTREEFPNAKLVITTGTHTGQDIAHKKFSEVADLITYFPFDCPSIVKKYLDQINPKTVLIAETEIWPNFAIACKKRGINLFIINGRISDSTFNTYKTFKFVFKQFMKLYTGVFTQSNEDNNKFLTLGANPETTKCMNNLKFDIKRPELTFTLNKGDYRVFLAGSTHQGEDEIVLETYKNLRDKNSDVRLILAPRHITRIDEIKVLVEKYGLKYDLRSNGKLDFEGIDVLLMDTLGELGKMYAFSDVSFIGGSFNKTGGHNPLESIVFNKPVISGPSIHNFKDIYAIIKRAEAGYVVKNQQEFEKIADKMFSDKTFYGETVAKCENVFTSQQGALQFVIDVLKNFM